MPKKIENTTICRISFFAMASTTLAGMVCSMKPLSDKAAVSRTSCTDPRSEAITAGIDAFASAYRGPEPTAKMAAFNAARATAKRG